MLGNSQQITPHLACSFVRLEPCRNSCVACYAPISTWLKTNKSPAQSRGLFIASYLGGDSSCADHNIAWRVRDAANLAFVPAGPSPSSNDQIIFTGETQGAGFEHPLCGATAPENETTIRDALPATKTVASGS